MVVFEMKNISADVTSTFYDECNTEGHSFKTLRFFQVVRLCSHRFTFMLMTWKISSIFSTVTARIIIHLISYGKSM